MADLTLTSIIVSQKGRARNWSCVYTDLWESIISRKILHRWITVWSTGTGVCGGDPGGVCRQLKIYWLRLSLHHLFSFLWPCVWDLSFPTRDQTYVSCTGRQTLNHWTTREVPPPLLLVQRIGEGVLSEITKTSKVGNITGRYNSLLLFSAPFSNRENSRGDFGSDHQWSQQCSLQRLKHIINTGKYQGGTNTNSLLPKITGGENDLERKKLTIHNHGSVQEKNFRELSWLLMLSVYSREKRLTHYDLGPVCPKNDAWMAGHRQLLSGDQEEKIRASPSFCQEQTWDPLFTAESSKFVYREDSLEGLSSRPKNKSISGNKGVVKSRRSVSWGQRAASTFQLLSQDQSNPPAGQGPPQRSKSPLQSLSPPIRGDCHLSGGGGHLLRDSSLPSLGCDLLSSLKVHGTHSYPSRAHRQMAHSGEGLLSRALSLSFWSSSAPSKG